MERLSAPRGRTTGHVPCHAERCPVPPPPPNAQVLVRHDRHHPCGHHSSRDLPIYQQVGGVDWIDERFGEHCYVVVSRR